MRHVVLEVMKSSKTYTTVHANVKIPDTFTPYLLYLPVYSLLNRRQGSTGVKAVYHAHFMPILNKNQPTSTHVR